MRKYIILLIINLILITPAYSEIDMQVLPSGDYLITAEGEGTDLQKAIINAQRNAVEKVCGVLIESETKVVNAQVVKDRIKTTSRGYITDYTEKKEKRIKTNDGYKVIIEATVSSKELSDAIERYKGKCQKKLEEVGDPPIATYIKAINKKNKKYGEDAESLIKEYLTNEKCTTIIKLDVKEKDKLLADEKLSPDINISDIIAQMYGAAYYIEITPELSNTHISLKIEAYATGTGEVIGAVSGMKRINNNNDEAEIKTAIKAIIDENKTNLYTTMMGYFDIYTKIGVPHTIVLKNIKLGKISELKDIISNCEGVQKVRFGNQSSNYLTLTVWITEFSDNKPLLLEDIEDYLNTLNKPNVEKNTRENKTIFYLSQ